MFRVERLVAWGGSDPSGACRFPTTLGRGAICTPSPAPSLHIIYHNFHHTSVDTPDLVPAGFQETVQAIAKIIEDVDAVEMSGIRGHLIRAGAMRWPRGLASEAVPYILARDLGAPIPTRGRVVDDRSR